MPTIGQILTEVPRMPLIPSLSHRFVRAAGLFVAACLALGAAWAQGAMRTETPAVIVTGKVRMPDGTKDIALTASVLEQLPQRTITTNAPWTKEPQAYTGVLLRDLLAHLGATGTSLQVTALNDYAASIPVEDARRFDVIVAHKVNGKPIPVRDRGPLLVMYPFDSIPELQNRSYYERAIWQVKSVHVQ